MLVARQRLRLALSIALTVGTSAIFVALPQQPAAAATLYIKIVDHNIEKKQSALNAALQKADATNATAITLQEVCDSQLAWLRNLYANRYQIASIQHQKQPLNGCTSEYTNSVVIWRLGASGAWASHYGNGLAESNVWWPAQPMSYSAPGAGGAMVCLEFTRGRQVHVCSLHLVAGDYKDANGVTWNGEQIRSEQTGYIKRVADGWPGAHFGVVAGDFNASVEKDSIDKIYHQVLDSGGGGDGIGRFTEYNRYTALGREGANTTVADAGAKKIDYVFFTRNHAPTSGPMPEITNTDADHHLIYSNAAMSY